MAHEIRIVSYSKSFFFSPGESRGSPKIYVIGGQAYDRGKKDTKRL